MIFLVICNWSVQSSCWRGWGGGHSSYLMKFSRVKLFISMPDVSSYVQRQLLCILPLCLQSCLSENYTFFGLSAHDFLCGHQRQLKQVAAYIGLHLKLLCIKNLIFDNIYFPLKCAYIFSRTTCHHFFHCFRLEVVYLVNRYQLHETFPLNSLPRVTNCKQITARKIRFIQNLLWPKQGAKMCKRGGNQKQRSKYRI